MKIDPKSSQTTKLGTSLKHDEENNNVYLLSENVDLFAWAPSYMPGIITNIMCEH